MTVTNLNPHLERKEKRAFVDTQGIFFSSVIKIERDFKTHYCRSALQQAPNRCSWQTVDRCPPGMWEKMQIHAMRATGSCHILHLNKGLKVFDCFSYVIMSENLKYCLKRFKQILPAACLVLQSLKYWNHYLQVDSASFYLRKEAVVFDLVYSLPRTALFLNTQRAAILKKFKVLWKAKKCFELL